jgi:metal-sulfur cluster biosynthetic enzyme
MGAHPVAAPTEEEIRQALGAVTDPELDEPITDLGFVRSVTVTDERIEVHLRLPTSFCSPNFAYLMASDAKDALTGLHPTGPVVVQLDDHHDSDLINQGLAADAGYRGTFGHEAERDLEELRQIFRRKAHAAAMERALTVLLRADPGRRQDTLHEVTLGDLPPGREREALMERRSALGFGVAATDVALVDDAGEPCPPHQAARLFRRARSVRISVDGNAHFCRGLLTTRYPGSEHDQTPRPGPDRPALPLLMPTPG